jgi:hypothetical protein
MVPLLQRKQGLNLTKPLQVMMWRWKTATRAGLLRLSEILILNFYFYFPILLSYFPLSNILLYKLFIYFSFKQNQTILLFVYIIVQTCVMSEVFLHKSRELAQKRRYDGIPTTTFILHPFKLQVDEVTYYQMLVVLVLSHKLHNSS